MAVSFPLALIYAVLITFYWQFDIYFEKNYKLPDENRCVTEFSLDYEYKRFDNLTDGFKQIQTLIGVIFTGLILFFAIVVAIGHSDNNLIGQGFLAGLTGVVFSLVSLVLVNIESLPSIETQSKTEIYQKIRKINQKNSYNVIFARCFLFLTIVFGILMILSIYYGYLSMAGSH